MTTNSTSVPFADPLWISRTISPYHNDSHRKLQKEVREYVDTSLRPYAEEWERQGSVPAEVSDQHKLLSKIVESNTDIMI
jgi:hypothetical protein